MSNSIISIFTYRVDCYPSAISFGGFGSSAAIDERSLNAVFFFLYFGHLFLSVISTETNAPCEKMSMATVEKTISLQGQFSVLVFSGSGAYVYTPSFL